jgi:hypothetical protein
VTKSAKDECSASKTIALNKKWSKDYKKMGYIFMSRENIYKKVSKLLQPQESIQYERAHVRYCRCKN